MSCCSLSATVAAVLPGFHSARGLKLCKAVGYLFGLQQMKDVTKFLDVLAGLKTLFWFWSRTNHCCFRFILKNLNAFIFLKCAIQSNRVLKLFWRQSSCCFLHKVSGKAY